MVELSGNNPYALLARSLTFDRLGMPEAALEDIGIARRVTGDFEEWTAPEFTAGLHFLFIENDPNAALQPLERRLEVQPDDWLTLTFIGVVYHLNRDYDTAHNFYQRAIANNPTSSYPYVLNTPVSIRRGELQQTQEYVDIVINDHTDPVDAIRITTSGYGDSVNSGLPHIIASYGHAVLGRHEAALEEANQALRYTNMQALPDLHMLKGFSHCNLSEFDEAIGSYSRAVALENNIAVLYLLRAESRFRQAVTLGPLRRGAMLGDATADLVEARALSPGPEVTAVLDAYQQAITNPEQTLNLSCNNILFTELPGSTSPDAAAS
ncbi:MAG: hypothetical protein AAF787_06515 [Chloroflexota bacterium]